MITIYQILNEIRKQKRYKRSEVAKHMQKPLSTLGALERGELSISDTTLHSWLYALDIPDKYHDWFLQYACRSSTYETIYQVLPKLTKQQAAVLATMIVTNQIPSIPPSLSGILPTPPIADSAISGIRDAR